MNWQQLFQQFGYPLVALGIGLESMGIPAPGETILLIAAAAAAAGTGNIVWVIVAAAAGAIIGDNVAFVLGRRYGRSLFRRLPFINDEKLAHSEAYFHKHGPKTIVIARFIPVVRSLVAYIAGINQMNHGTFTGYNLIGGLLWATTIGSLGFIFGKNLHLLELWLQRAGGIWVAILLLGGLLLWLNHRWHQGESQFRLGRISALVESFRHLMSRGRPGLVIYGLCLIASGWAAGVLVDDWVEREPELYRRDQLATIWLKLGAEELSPWVEPLTWLGDMRFLAGIVLLTAGWLWSRGRRRLSFLTILNFVIVLAMGWGFQLWFKRPLPPASESSFRLTAYAFPHLGSLLAISTYGWLAMLWARNRSWGSLVNGTTTAAFFSVVVGFVGLYVSQAYISDVLAGLTLGFLWLGIPYTIAFEGHGPAEARVGGKR